MEGHHNDYIGHQPTRVPGRGRLGTASIVGLPGSIEAAELTASEKANVTLVNDMCRAWMAPVDFDKVGGFLADDCVFRASETSPPIKGRQAIVDALKKMLGSPSKAEFEVVQTFARGSVVVNERFDRFVMPKRNIDWHGVGVFIVRDGKIAEWSDFTIRANA
jgi:limonene-1,2-epoxide hydrolase